MRPHPEGDVEDKGDRSFVAVALLGAAVAAAAAWLIVRARRSVPSAPDRPPALRFRPLRAEPR